MWSLLDKNCVSQKEIRDVKSIKIRKSSLKGIMKMSIRQMKSLFWVDKVVSWAHNDRESSIKQMKSLFWADEVADWVNTVKESIGRMKSLFWADEVANWAQREVAIRAQIEAVVKTEIKLSSFFLLLACLLCSCLLCCCSRDKQCSDRGRIWWNHFTTVQKSSLRGVSTVVKMQLVCLLKHFSHSY